MVAPFIVGFIPAILIVFFICALFDENFRKDLGILLILLVIISAISLVVGTLIIEVSK